MKRPEFNRTLKSLMARHEALLRRPNIKVNVGNGVYDRYANPVVTAAHTPLSWRYDFNSDTNPYLMERIGINAAFNSGAIEHDGKILLFVARRGRRPQIVLRGGRIQQRDRQVSASGITRGHARDRRSRLQCL